MANSSDATPTYRGYRHQALYALYRIFENSNTDYVFQPEGTEDFTVFDTAGNLVEVVQVKSYERNLILSSFKPDKKDSFFYRIADLLKSNSNVRVVIASFGALGQELEQAFLSEGKNRNKLAQKLSKYNLISEADAEELLGKIHFILVNEAEITTRVMNILGSTLPLVDAKNAFGLLQHWLFDCSEKKTKITYQDFIDQVNKVGKFIAERAEHYSQWGTIITPIIEHDFAEHEKEQLADEFYQGVSTRYDHIVAGLDVIRPTKLAEISRRFQDARIVIIHGASGQGKSTLAYRYLHEYFPNEWRFQVKSVENKQHANSIATALIGYADALKLPMAVYVDVAASDRDWPELLQQLAAHRSIRLLITIREEDFQRASITGATFAFEQVSLSFEETEARKLYGALTQQQTSIRFLDFEEAWRQFGGAGPLMEFVYLVTQGNLLREKLVEQVARLEEDVATGKLSANELTLLRMISVASAFGARLQVKTLVKILGLAVPKRTFRYYEKEYLLRLSEDGSLVYGLHPIRSAMLCDLLTDQMFDTWIDIARSCLPIIYGPDVEIFLLYAFSQRKSDSHFLVASLVTYQTDQWLVLAGVTRALIWLGVREYVDINREVFREAYADSGKGWFIFLDYDIADAIPGVASGSWESFQSLVSQERLEKLKTLQRRQTDKKEIFRYAKDWLVSRSQKPAQPATDAEWSAMGETLFWAGRLAVTWPLQEWLTETKFELAIETLPIEVLGNVILGVSEGDREFFFSLMETQRSRIIVRFRQVTRTISLEDDGQKVTAHFIVELEPTFGGESILVARLQAAKDRFSEEANIRIDLLRRLIPNRELYACQGYGHHLWEEIPFDSTTKTHVRNESLPPLWLTSLNSTFRALAERDFRPKAWSEYVQILVDMRRDAIDVLKQFVHAAERYFRNQQFISMWGNLIDADNWLSCSQNFKHPVTLPTSALDKWGLIDESASNPRSLERHQNAFSSYVNSFGNYLEQSVHVLIVNPSLGRQAKDPITRATILDFAQKKGIRTDLAHLSTNNFADAVKAMPQFQREFRQLFNQFVNNTELGDIERQELHLYRQAWYFWYFFANQPQRSLPHPNSLINQSMNSIHNIRRTLLKEFRKLLKEGLRVRIVSEEVLWDYTPALWLTIDGDNPITVYEAFVQVIDSIRQAAKNVIDTDLRQHMLEFHWPYVVIVPLVRGKLLTFTAWRLSMRILMQEEELKWWNYAQSPIPSEAITELGMTSWNNPRLEPALKFAAGMMGLSLYAAHIGNFLKMPETDELGVNLFQAYLEQAKRQLQEIYQAVVDAKNIIVNTFNQLSQAEKSRNTHLQVVVEALVEMQTALLPAEDFDGYVALTIEDIGEWAERLKKAQKYAAIVYFYWVSYVLETDLEESG